MRVLVTGGCGLIGYHISSYYKRNGHEVFVMDNLERSDLLGHKISKERKYYNLNELVAMGVQYFNEDVSDPAGWGRFNGIEFDAIFHMAAQCGVPTSIANPVRDFEVNAIGTFRMLEYAKNYGGKVVYASTNKVYPLHNQALYQWRIDEENNRWRWDLYTLHKEGFPVIAMDDDGSRTPYGTSKYTGDLLCQEYHHTYGVPTGIFRMSCIYGDHQFGFEEQGWATWFAIATLKGLPLKVYGDGKQVRDMLWVEDVVKAYDAFVTSETVDHGVWNLGGGPRNTLSINECVDLLEVITGKRSEVSYHDWRPSDQRIYTSSINRLRRTFGWEPTVSPSEGMERIVRWAEPITGIF